MEGDRSLSSRQAARSSAGRRSARAVRDFRVLRSGALWSEIPERYDPRTTVDKRFNRRRKAGVWDRLMETVVKAHHGVVQMIETAVVACISTVRRPKGG